MKLPLAGGAYIDPHIDANYKQCINYYAALSGPGGEGSTVTNPYDSRQQATAVMRPTPGKKLFVDLGTGKPVRAIINFQDTIYAVSSNTLYKLTINDDNNTATASSVGTLTYGTQLIKWTTNPTQIYLTDGTVAGGYIHTVSTDTLTNITDGDYLGAQQVAFLDSYFVASTPSASTITTSATNNGSAWDALDVATAESQPDRTVGLIVLNGELWVFGERSTEIWYDAANATGLPFSKRIGADINRGCSAKNSISRFNDGVAWLDDRRYIVMSAGTGYAYKVISTPALMAEFQKYKDVSNAYAWTDLTMDGNFYCISFPDNEITWCYDATTELWHRRAYYSADQRFVHDLTYCSVRYKNKLSLLGSRIDGKIYISDRETYKDGTDYIHRVLTITSQVMDRDLIGVDEATLICSTGTALASGTGSDPQIMMRYSNDGGRNWSHEMWRNLGTQGDYAKEITWNRLGTARRWAFEFRMFDPMDHVLMAFNVKGQTEGGPF